MTTHSHGRFVWHELATTDVKRAVGFYSELFSWSTTEMDMGPAGKYTMLKSGETNVGGMTPHVAPPGAGNVPPHWRTYCTVPDVDAAAKRAAESGGKVLKAPMDIPDVGRFAVVADPQGAILLPFKDAREPAELQGMPAVGTFCWDELLTPDPAAAAKFYEPIYGWKITEQDMGPHGTYRVLHRGDKMSGGIMKSPMPGVHPHWAAYVAVANIDTSAKRAESLGGKIVVQPQEIPGMGRFAVFVDPTGASLCMFQGK